MQINSTNYEQKELNYITEAGNYLLKLKKYELDGMSQNGEAKIKVTFEAKKINEAGKLEGDYSINYFMFDGAIAGFTVAMLRDALNSPRIFDLDDWVDRFVNAKIEMELSTKDNKNYAKIKSFEYSKFNDKLPPIKGIEGKSSESKSSDVEDDMSELPF